MKVEYDGKAYDFDLEDIDVSQATQIKKALGLTLGGLEAGLADGDPDALRAIFWLMLTNSGERVNIQAVNFKILRFAKAMQEATAREQAELSDAEKAENEGKEAAA